MKMLKKIYGHPTKQPWKKTFHFQDESLTLNFPAVEDQYNWSVVPTMDSSYVSNYSVVIVRYDVS